ncbi:MAG TPA: tRNA (adenosine(37)-N6)-dimethylallyltransferase MiaA [Anaerolineae bacterium]|nr:tRNA (adenosine(37)-N6)-dimethylallyltransferase MiaA [Anaerolineae bacterium]
MNSVTKPQKPPLVVIIGPTAVGKTKISIRVAERVGGEIISADSRLVYIGMDIGTAKPSLEDRARVPHHLIDVATPDKILSLADYQVNAKRLIKEIIQRGNIPFLVGGTGQYIRAITQGWTIPEVIPNEKIRLILERWAVEIGYAGLHQRLSVIDPNAAGKIDPTNLRRTIRALEVIFLTGERFSDKRGAEEVPYRILQIGLFRPRTELYQRIDERIDQMLMNGFEEEVRELLNQGYSTETPPLSAIGYRQMIAYVQGEITLEEAVLLMKRKTRVFVRHQANWFKKDDPLIEWYPIEENLVEGLVKRITGFVNKVNL